MGSFHARSLALLPDVEIAAIGDPREAAARTLADAVGGTPTTDGLAVAAMADLDGLVISSPEDGHEALVMAAFEQGTPVLCEKPLAVGATACKRIVDAEVAMGHRLLQLGLIRVTTLRTCSWRRRLHCSNRCITFAACIATCTRFGAARN